MLVNLAKAAFEEANWPTEVLTGRFTFKFGGGNRHVASAQDEDEPHL